MISAQQKHLLAVRNALKPNMKVILDEIFRIGVPADKKKKDHVSKW